MLTYLKVRNLAIVEEFAVEPGAGLNVLTGETGAGKSLLIDSLEFLGGARGSSDSIRSGAEKLSAEAVFHLPSALSAGLQAVGIDVEPAGGTIELIVRRELSISGRGRVLVNGSPMTARDLAATMEPVLEIHGQIESHQRIAGKSYRELLDQFGNHQDLLQASSEAHRVWQTKATELSKLTDAQKELSLRLDLLKYQIDELSSASLEPAEEESLRGERAILSHAREVIEATAGSYVLLEDDEASALTQIGRASHLLSALPPSIAEVRKLVEDLEEARFRVEEVARELVHLSESVRHDPARLDEIEERLVTIERMKKKYGGSVESAQSHLEAIRAEFETLTDYETNLEKLEIDEKTAFDSYRRNAETLSKRRGETAKRFEKAIQKELDDLAMEGTTVRIVVGMANSSDSRLRIGDRAIHFGPYGYDSIDILIAPNRGEEPRPMQRIASGGELSRIQLAVATALFRESDESVAATLIFDEIDAGIGGRVADAVGNKLRDLATTNQVICVTHLPQIAGLATTHFRVWKEDVDGRTRARIERLDSRETRIEEIARMLGGSTVTASARTHAAELLARGEEEKGRKRDRSRAVAR